MRSPFILILAFVALFTPIEHHAAGQAENSTVAWGGWAVHHEHGPAGRFIVVDRVTPNGPAARAGLRPGDIITRIDGNDVQTFDELDLVLYVAGRRPGSQCRIGYMRDGKESELTVVLLQMPTNLLPRWKAGVAHARAVREQRATQKGGATKTD